MLSDKRALEAAQQTAEEIVNMTIANLAGVSDHEKAPAYHFAILRALAVIIVANFEGNMPRPEQLAIMNELLRLHCEFVHERASRLDTGQ